MSNIIKYLYARSSAYKVLLSILSFVLTSCASAPPSYPGHIDLSGARNFRDLGGYQSIDGRRIKKGVLFRSDELKSLTKHDLEVISKIGLKRIYDLRNKEEQQDDPNELPLGHAIKQISVPFAFAPLDETVMRSRILKGQVEEGDNAKLMLESYKVYSLDYQEQIGNIIRGLADSGELPTLIHCIHGKDRTGLVVAMILEILRIPEDVIMQDYLLSNLFWESETKRLSNLAYIGSFFRTPASEVRSLMEARPEYLDVTSEQILKHYGSEENYIREGLKLDDATVEKIRNTLLE